MSKKAKSKKKKSKSEPKISMPNNKIRSLCMTTDIVFDIRDHHANKNNIKIIKAFARQYSNKIDSMQDIFGVISSYFIYLCGNSVSGEWKYYKKDDDRGTCNYIMKIKDNLSFNILLRYYGGCDSEQSLILNGNILIINDTTFLLFFDQESAKMFRNTKGFRSRILNGYVWEEPFFNMSYRDSIYLNRVLKIYKKHKVNIKKKYRSQIETVSTLQKEFKKKKNIINNSESTGTVRWEHILLKHKQMRLAKIITANKAKKEFIKRRLTKNFESKYRATEHHKLYAKICAKYNEIVLPVYLGPLMLHFEDCNRTKCMLYYGKEPVFKQWLSNSSTSHEKI